MGRRSRDNNAFLVNAVQVLSREGEPLLPLEKAGMVDTRIGSAGTQRLITAKWLHLFSYLSATLYASESRTLRRRNEAGQIVLSKLRA